MNQTFDLPHDVETEKQLLAALLFRNGAVVPAVADILAAEDFYRPEHQIIFRAVLKLFAKGTPPNILSIFEELRQSKEIDKIDRKYLMSIAAMTFTDAYAVAHANIIKEKSDLRKLIHTAQVVINNAQKAVQPSAEIIAEARRSFDALSRSVVPSKRSDFTEYFADQFYADVDAMKSYADRKTGFDNLDAQQFFTPGLYVIGATPAAGKTTFCWQLLEQLARQGENCIFCSYEMSRLELFSKSLAREMFRNDKHAPTSAQLRRGASIDGLHDTQSVLADLRLNLSVLELQDESVDELIKLLRPLCMKKSKAPVVCLDYLQIVPTDKDTAKLGIDDAVRKLKKFQRDTNTTFIVISSFNRTNYAQAVSFESFKESGNIEYTADVVWALQLNIMGELKSNSLISDSRKRIEAAKKQQPRQIQLRCLKNRQGMNYDCFFEYYSAHDCFEACEPFDEITPPPTRISDRDRKIINGRL